MQAPAIFSLVTCLVCVLMGPWQGKAQGPVNVAVLEFRNTSGAQGVDELCAVVPEMLKTELSRSAAVKVLERTALEGVMKELALAQGGLLDDQLAVAVGQMTGARYVIQGAISYSRRALRLDAHIVEVSTGAVMGEKVEGQGREALPKMVSLLARNILFVLTGEGYYRQQERLRTYPASLVLGGTIVCGIATLVAHLNYRDAYREYEQATRLADFDRTYDRANGYLKARNVLLGVTGAGAMLSFALLTANSVESNYLVAAATPLQQLNLSLCPLLAGKGMCLELSYRW